MAEETKKKRVKKIGKTEEVQHDKRGVITKLNDFFRRNNYVAVALLILMMLVTLYDNRSYKEETTQEVKRAVAYIKKNLNTIGYLTATGMLVTTKREALSYNDPRLKLAIINSVTEPILQSGSDITEDYNKKYKSMSQMVKHNTKMYHLYKDYCYPSKLAQAEMKKVFKGIYKMVASFQYPDYITIRKVKQDQFSISKKRDEKTNEEYYEFSANITYYLSTQNWLIQFNKWRKGKNVVQIKFSGVINPARYANADNLLGFKIKKISMPILIKPEV